MIHLDFDPSNLTGDQRTEWNDWQSRADSATEDLIHTWETSKKLSDKDFDNDIWTELKKFLLDNVFHGKCAYCETHIGMARQSGDAEHFRPKRRVNYREEGKLTTVEVQDPTGQPITHPGYFWLAYNWKNLVPACRKCNSEQGKKNQFPTKGPHVLLRKLSAAELDSLEATALQSPSHPEFYYLQPEDLDRLEDRLLLHPYYDNPRAHLQFVEHGIEAPAPDESNEPSPKGEHSIEVYDLKNDDLRRARDTAQRFALMKFFTAYTSAASQGQNKEASLQAAWNTLTEVIDGKEPYSAAVLDFIRLHCQNLGLC